MQTNVFYINCDGGKGTGFFFKIPIIGKLIPVFVTANHVIDEDYLAKNSEIKINTNKDKAPKTIQLKNKFIFTDKDYDVTMIEIDENKDGEYEYLEPDDRILKEELIDNLKGTSIYTLQYPVNQSPTLAVSYGILKRGVEDKKYDFIHYCCTQEGSSGSPILNIENNKVIGIHKQAHEKRKYNIGSYLYYSIKGFIDKYNDGCLKKYKKPSNPKRSINNIGTNKIIKNNINQENKINNPEFIKLNVIKVNKDNKRYGKNNETKISKNPFNIFNASIAKSNDNNKKGKKFYSIGQEKSQIFHSIQKDLFGIGNQTKIKLKKFRITGLNDKNNIKLPPIPSLWEKKIKNIFKRNQSCKLLALKKKSDF